MAKDLGVQADSGRPSSDAKPPALAGMRLLFSTARSSDRAGLDASLGLGFAASVLAPLFPLIFKALVDAADRHDLPAVTAAAVALAVLTVSGSAARSYSVMFGWNVWERVTITIDEQLVALTGRLGLVDRVERKDFLEHLTLVRTNREHFQESMMSLLGAVFLSIQVVGTIVVLATVAPVLLVLPLFSAAPILASRWSEGRAQRALRESAAETRTADGVALLSIEAPAAGELRVLRLAQWLTGRHRTAWERAVGRQWRAETLGAGVSAAALMVFTVGFGAGILFVTVQAVNGAATLGSVILVLTAGQQLHNQIGGVLSSSGDLFRIVETMRHFAWLARYADEHQERGSRRPPESLREGIELEHLSFRYANSERDALHDVSLFLPAGVVVAVVGENGAGKTTLVKLLCGLHRPSTGRITVDGVDLTELDAPAWRGSISGAFQDFVRFEVLARESVGVGQVTQAGSVERVRRALALADVVDLEDELPQGLETPLGRAFLEGIDLSGGQWQKVALGRSMMRDAPLILVLDEPTYSLDVESERRVFDWFTRIARSETRARTITIIVSHRFSTVRAADLVAVMHEGRVVEVGSHADLLADGGVYAAMYRSQAEGYR